jgi:hypothetical protein
VPAERQLSGEHLVQDHAEAVDVGSRVEVALARRLFRAHVRRSAHRQPGLRQPLLAGGADRARDAEIGEDGLVALEQDVLRLDVAVDHSVGVGVVQRAQHLAGDLKRVIDGKLALPVKPLTEALPIYVRHGVPELVGAVGSPCAGAGIEDRQDVGMLEPGGDPDLVEEALGPECGRQIGMQHLEGYRAVVPQIVGEIDGRHTAPANLAVEPVASFQGLAQSVEAHASRAIPSAFSSAQSSSSSTR